MILLRAILRCRWCGVSVLTRIVASPQSGQMFMAQIAGKKFFSSGGARAIARKTVTALAN